MLGWWKGVRPEIWGSFVPRVLGWGWAEKGSFWVLRFWWFESGIFISFFRNLEIQDFTIAVFLHHNLALTCWSCRSSDDTPSRTSSTVRSTHSVPSSLESHLSSSVWFSVFRAFSRPKIWLVNCGPTPPSARRDAIPTTEPKARLRFPWSRSSRLLVSE